MDEMIYVRVTRRRTISRRVSWEVSLDDNSSMSVIVSSVDLKRASRSCCSAAERTSLCVPSSAIILLARGVGRLQVCVRRGGMTRKIIEGEEW